jgi:hypothetical protein
MRRAIGILGRAKPDVFDLIGVLLTQPEPPEQAYIPDQMHERKEGPAKAS